MASEDTRALYGRQGFGQRMGFGEVPAVLIVDMQNDFVDPAASSTVAPMAARIVEPIARLCAAARAARVPVFFTKGVVSKDGLTEGLWRFKSRGHPGGRVQGGGPRGAEIIDALLPQPGDIVIVKRRPSAFFHTDLEVYLRRLRVDTLLIGGTSVSGCVRASVTDAFMRDIRPMVVRECVADRTAAVMEANLFDLDQKYADVVTLADALTYLDRLHRTSRPVPA